MEQIEVNMESKELKIEQIRENGNLTCKLTGWLDPNTSPDLVEKIDLTDVKMLVLDMSNVEYVFSAGLRALLMLERMLDVQNGKIKLINIPEQIRFIFEDTGFESMLE